MAIIKSPKKTGFSVSFVFRECLLLWWKERKCVVTGSGSPAGADPIVAVGPRSFSEKYTDQNF